VEAFLDLLFKYWLWGDIFGLITVVLWIYVIAPPKFVPTNKAILDCITPAQSAAFYTVVISFTILIVLLCIAIVVGLTMTAFR